MNEKTPNAPSITHFSGTLKDGDWLRLGKYAECRGDVARAIEGAFA